MRLGQSLGACGVGLALLVPVASSARDNSPTKGPRAPGAVIGLALTSWQNALVETPKNEECPDGLQSSEIDQLRAMPEGYDRIRRGGGMFENRGPSGETGNFSPLIFNEPLPFKELGTKVGYGVNLDGTQDGRATAKSRKHEKFTSPEGEKVDNELARVIGCVMGYRTGGFNSDYYTQEVADFSVNRHLIEISGVDDEANDDAVTVTIYKGYDRLVRRGDGKFVPFLSQRIDPRFPQYTFSTRGKIVNGTLITEPIARAVLPHSSMRDIAERDMRDMTLRLKLNPEGAEGLLAGYDHWKKWYNLHSKKMAASNGSYSSPLIYRAFQRYADGYPDATTGEYAYISAAYKVTAVRAMIVGSPHGARRAVASARN